MAEISLRRARPDEAEQLTQLVVRAKASWGYDQHFMDACRAELTMTPEKFEAWTIWVAEYDGQLAGMSAVSIDGKLAELEDLMVEPQFQGRGVGAALMNALIEECRSRGLKRIGLAADPNAEPIYEKFGFSTVGQSPSKSIPGRMLPRMVMAI